MLAYHLRVAAKSLRRGPVLSALLVAGIGLGIAVSTAFVAAYRTVAQDPIPGKSHKLYYVELDAWNPKRPYDDDHPKDPPNQLTWRDANALMASPVPTQKSAMFRADLTLFPASRDERPFRADTRLTFRDFFTMFDVPFRYGGPWGADADRAPQAVVVLDDATNQKVFGGGNSVGKKVRLEDRDFTVVGVLEPWYPKPKFYDPHNGAFNTPEEIYIPFNWTVPMQIVTGGNTSGWGGWGPKYEDKLASEAIWLQYWVQLDTPQQREAYLSWLNGYAGEQKKLGRFQRPLNNRLLDVPAWLNAEEVVPKSAKTMLVISLLFLVVSSVNLIGILLGKFLARSPEVGVRRALGASRAQVFLQHIIECELVALLGGIVGVLASIGVLRGIEHLNTIGAFEPGPPLLTPDVSMLAVGLLLALFAGFIAGIYPAWRICRVPPAAHLKQQ